MPHEQAVQIIRESRGSHFDPDVVDGFLACADDFRAIAMRYADTVGDMALKAEQLRVFTETSG